MTHLWFLLLVFVYIGLVSRGFRRWPPDWYPGSRAADAGSATLVERKTNAWRMALGMLVVLIVLYLVLYWMHL
jgi:hypothetical protein